ncbi:hypothetical protein Bca52824_029176 [Brassica carinata]|uniref:Uncharacterized protein n=1 Tax=Brassica carinata TaxID=52824 RepID=A0A8X8ARB4_BRACI|nr:hypothetical protein Bca52824_029176 [Brassica carinata]
MAEGSASSGASCSSLKLENSISLFIVDLSWLTFSSFLPELVRCFGFVGLRSVLAISAERFLISQDSVLIIVLMVIDFDMKVV